jgi:hypothetical protein
MPSNNLNTDYRVLAGIKDFICFTLNFFHASIYLSQRPFCFQHLYAHLQKFQLNLSLHLGSAESSQGVKPKFSYGAGAELGINFSPKFAFLVKPMIMSRGTNMLPIKFCIIIKTA